LSREERGGGEDLVGEDISDGSVAEGWEVEEAEAVKGKGRPLCPLAFQQAEGGEPTQATVSRLRTS
jgi:hypothetical protein